MNILYINHYAGSPLHGMEYRPYYLAREWLKAGHKVAMLSASHSHVRAHQPDLTNTGDGIAFSPVAPAFRSIRCVTQDIDGIQYHWYATPPYGGNGVGRVKNMTVFLRQLWQDAPIIARDFQPDIVIASSTYPMDIWVAKRICKLAQRAGKACKLVFEVHDLWPLSPIELGGMSPKHPFIRVCQAAEDYAYKQSDVVISMLPKVADHMQSHGLDLRKLHIVPNGVDPDEWRDAEPLSAELAGQFKHWRAEGIRLVGYAGAHGVANALDALLDTAKLMEQDKVCFVLAGTGPDKAQLQTRATQMGLKNLHFLPPVRKNQVPSLLQQLDIAYIGLQNQPLFRFGIAPNKLMDYMMAARPVVMAIRAGNDPVADSGCGITVEPENPAAIAAALRDMLGRSNQSLTDLGQNGRAYMLENHTYPVLAKRFLAACA